MKLNLKPKVKQVEPYQIEPASCKHQATFADVAEWPDGPAAQHVFERKEDGCRYLLQIRPNGTFKNFLTSRHISKQTGKYVEKQDSVPWLRDATWSPELRDTVLDGEWVVDGGNSHDAVHAMSEGKGHYVVWDILILNGVDLRELPLRDRLIRLKFIAGKLPGFIELAKQSNDAKKFLASVLAENGEGIIKKELSAPYGKGWTKVKGSDNFDCVIYDYEETKSEAFAKKGWIGAVKIVQVVLVPKAQADKVAKMWGKRYVGRLLAFQDKAVLLIAVGRASNMTQAVRDDISKHRDEYRFRVVEVKAHQRYPNGYFRSPRFIQFRDDKSPHQCLLPESVKP